MNNPIRPSGVKHPIRVRSFPWYLKISGKHLPSLLHDDKIDVDAEVLNIPLASLLTLAMCVWGELLKDTGSNLPA